MTTILKRPKNDEVPNPENLKKGIKFGEGQDPTKGGAPKGKRVTTILKEILGKDSTEIGIDNLPEGMDGNKALALELLTIAFSKKSRDNDKLSAIKEILLSQEALLSKDKFRSIEKHFKSLFHRKDVT